MSASPPRILLTGHGLGQNGLGPRENKAARVVSGGGPFPWVRAVHDRLHLAQSAEFDPGPRHTSEQEPAGVDVAPLDLSGFGLERGDQLSTSGRALKRRSLPCLSARRLGSGFVRGGPHPRRLSRSVDRLTPGAPRMRDLCP
jgi:hypothetical protein